MIGTIIFIKQYENNNFFISFLLALMIKHKNHGRNYKEYDDISIIENFYFLIS